MRRLTAVGFVGCLLAAGCHHPKATPPLHPRARIHPPTSYRRRPPPPSPARGIHRRPPRTFHAAWMPRGGRISPRWNTIVIHHSATRKGGAVAFDKFHRNKGWDELGYHFVIGNGTDTPDGMVEVGSRWHKQKHGAHCKTPNNYYNDHGIGICLVGDFTKGRPTRRQMASLTKLVGFLSQRCGIAPGHVTTHRDVTHKTACPGRRFPLAQVRRSAMTSATASSMP